MPSASLPPSEGDAAVAYERAVARDYRRNTSAIVAWEFLWALGLPFALFAVSVPAYLGALGAPKALIGLVLSFPAIFSAGQILVGYWVPAPARLAVCGFCHAGCVLPWFAYAGAAFLWGAAWPAWFHAAAFTVAQLVFAGVTNLMVSLYWEIMIDIIPSRKRGRLFGWRMAAIGLPVLLTGGLAARVLAHWPPPRNFQAAFLIGTAIYGLSCAALWCVRDHVNPAHARPTGPDAMPLGRYLAAAFRTFLGNPNYRVFLFFLVLLYVTVNGAPFLVDAARTQLQVSSRAQGFFGVAYLLASMGLGWIVGLLADRFGYRLIGGLLGVAMFGVYLIVLLSGRVGCWYVAYGLYGACFGSLSMLLCNMSAELFPGEPPQRLVAVGNAFTGVSVLLASTLGGWIVDRTGAYQPLFIANLVLSLVVVLGFALLVREPRSGRLYQIVVAAHN